MAWGFSVWAVVSRCGRIDIWARGTPRQVTHAGVHKSRPVSPARSAQPGQRSPLATPAARIRWPRPVSFPGRTGQVRAQRRFRVALATAPIAGATLSHRPIVTTIDVI